MGMRERESRIVCLTTETEGIDAVISSSAPRFLNRPTFLTESDRLKGRVRKKSFCPTLLKGKNHKSCHCPCVAPHPMAKRHMVTCLLPSWKKVGERVRERERER